MQRRTRLAAAAVALMLATATGYAVGHAQAAPQTMYQALSYLKYAQSSLEVNTLDPGGHRVNALNLVNRALVETQAGIDASLNHGLPGAP